MNTLGYMTAVKDRLRLTSDYQLSKKLDVSTQAVSKWRVGKSTMGDELAPTIARILDIPTERVLADLHAERERNPELVQFWQSISRQFARAACMLAALIALNITLAPETKAAGSLAASHSSAEYKFPIIAAVRRICRLIVAACKFAYFGTARGTMPRGLSSV